MCVFHGWGRREDCPSQGLEFNVDNCLASLPSVLPNPSGVAYVVLKFLAFNAKSESNSEHSVKPLSPPSYHVSYKNHTIKAPDTYLF